jgi:hypothetical protein
LKRGILFTHRSSPIVGVATDGSSDPQSYRAPSGRVVENLREIVAIRAPPARPPNPARR